MNAALTLIFSCSWLCSWLPPDPEQFNIKILLFITVFITVFMTVHDSHQILNSLTYSSVHDYVHDSHQVLNSLTLIYFCSVFITVFHESHQILNSLTLILSCTWLCSWFPPDSEQFNINILLFMTMSMIHTRSWTVQH